MKYKNLIRDASRDENILINLENELRMITLDEARIQDPWKLITTPFLRTLPLPPSRTIIAFYGVLIGIIVGCIISLLKEKLSGLVFDEILLKQITQADIIDNISLEKNSLENYNKEIIANQILKDEKGKEIKLINAGLDDSILDKILKIAFKDEKLIKFESDFSAFNQNDKLILFTDLKSLSYKEINGIMNRLKILNKKLDGIFLIKDY